MKKGIVFLLLLCVFAKLNAQIGLDLENYSFIPTVNFSSSDAKTYEKDDAVFFYYGRAFDYRINQTTQDLELWAMLHFSVKIQKKDFVDAANMFEIATSNKDNIINCGGKLTKEDGRIEILGKKDLVQEIEDDDEDTTLLLKFPNANVGDIIEFFYVIRTENVPVSHSFGFPMHGNLSVKKFEATIISPQWLNFDVMGYNGLPAVIDTTLDNKLRYKWLEATNLARVPDEPMSLVRAYLPRVEFVLIYNYNTGNKRLNTLNYYADAYYKIFNDFDKTEQKALKKINSTVKIDKKLPPLEQAKQMEDFIKTNYLIIDYGADVLKNFDFIQRNKLMNGIGCAKLLYNIFKIHNIKADVVLTTDRTEKAFDKKANNGNFLNEVLLYLPDYKEYTSFYPSARISMPSPFLSACQALIFKTSTLNNVSNFYSEFCDIPLPAAEKSQDIIEATIKLSPDDNLITSSIKRTLSGYCAGMLQVNETFADPEDYDEPSVRNVIDYYLGLGTESFNVRNIKGENTKNIGHNPLILTADVEDYYDLTKSNDTLTFTIGNYIGKQSEISRKEARTLPIERIYNVVYKRIITVEIPNGYQCINAKDLEQTVLDNEIEISADAAFIVKTQIIDNKVIITCDEYYKRSFYPVSEADGVLNVVEASANFNKELLKFIKK